LLEPVERVGINCIDLNAVRLYVFFQVISGRHLTRTKKGPASTLVEVEIHGCTYDCSQARTKAVCKLGSDNSYPNLFKLIFSLICGLLSITASRFSPTWHETFQFKINNRALSLIRFVVFDVDKFENRVFQSQATFPVNCIRSGYRSVPLKNGWSEELELSSLLVYIQLDTASGLSPNVERLTVRRSQIQLGELYDCYFNT
jgi:phosphatidylinositol phospholipase C gamma-1